MPRVVVHSSSPPVAQTRTVWVEPRVRQVRGEIVQLREAEFEGFGEDHLVARVRPNGGGGTVDADLGPHEDLKYLDLDTGDLIWVEGRMGQIEEDPVLIGQRLEAKGRDITLRQESHVLYRERD